MIAIKYFIYKFNNMKSVKLFFLAAALSAGISVTAQTADEIVEKNIAAMG